MFLESVISSPQFFLSKKVEVAIFNFPMGDIP